ncbi:MAG: 5-bromo-4-chloroindolyl phosphate hydrolysis family protein [Clostridia bacterium]|nr:5-bromo-4-chloroindolyl phosphate hydrolysis family protein [Clostridia bacterium]
MPSLAIGIGAFCAGELVQYVNKKDIPKAKSLTESIAEAKEMNTQIARIIPKIEDEELVKNIKEINNTTKKIIETIEKKPEKYKVNNNFFNYYLPVTVNILNKYDEIENQNLTTEESKKFMESTKRMVIKINDAFKSQLSNLYQSDMIDTDAEMKVFDSMLKADGYNPNDDFNI